MSKNDERVLQLKKLIETKKSELSTQRFAPMTNCVLDMEDKKYKPLPIDTSDVVLPKDLLPLVETMAKNVHEVWAQSRINEGWTYGSERNDAEKKHPCLVPYEKLSDMEKDYDRNTSVETLKLIMKLGFKITK